MKNGRQIYFSGNFTSDGNSYAQPVKALDGECCSMIIILGAIIMFAVVVEMLISRI